jgi:hypothetical protein
LSLDGAKLVNLTKYYTFICAFYKIIQKQDNYAFRFKILKKYKVFINSLVFAST